MSRLPLDWWLIVPIFLLSITGVVVLLGTSPELVSAQLVFLLTAAVAFLLVSVVGYHLLFSLHWPIYLISLVFLITPFFLGTASRGAHRWIQITPSLSLQPSELIKPFLLVTFVVLAVSSSRVKLPLLIAASLLPVTIIFFQPDLGTALVILVGWFTVSLSKVPLKIVLVTLGLSVICLLPVYKFFLLDYQRDRLHTFLDPYSDPLNRGYHVIQSLIAVGSGGLFGRGLGHGPQSNLRFLPERHTDFIFASLGESFGFVGSAAILLIFLFLIRRIYQISQATPDPAASLYCLAATALLAFQVTINVSMNLGLAPVTGITLPFLSYGGSSLLSVFFMLGLINSISATHRPHSG